MRLGKTAGNPIVLKMAQHFWNFGDLVHDHITNNQIRQKFYQMTEPNNQINHCGGFGGFGLNSPRYFWRRITDLHVTTPKTTEVLKIHVWIILDFGTLTKCVGKCLTIVNVGDLPPSASDSERLNLKKNPANFQILVAQRKIHTCVICFFRCWSLFWDFQSHLSGDLGSEIRVVYVTNLPWCVKGI